jgi:hypothetical protein
VYRGYPCQNTLLLYLRLGDVSRDAGGECLSARMSRQLWDVDGAPVRKEAVAAWTWGRQTSRQPRSPAPPRSCQGGRGSHAAERLHDLSPRTNVANVWFYWASWPAEIISTHVILLDHGLFR